MALDIPHFLRDKTILVTGATGFLAKVLVEKILRVQPYVKKLYLLIRAPDSNTAKQRLKKELYESDLFRLPEGKWGGGSSSLLDIDNEIAVAVDGDVSQDNLGIKETELRTNMWNEIDIIINSAATTKFDERYDFALSINTLGAKNIIEFAKRCVKLQMILHISTAYVRGDTNRVVREDAFSMGETQLQESDIVLDINNEKQVVEETIRDLQDKGIPLKETVVALKELGIKRARMHGWVNTYSFTKAMGEMILMNFHEGIPLAIVRPTIVTSTYKEPFPGWIEGFRTLDSIAITYGKGRLKCFLGDPHTILDLIPVDMVVNAILLGIAANVNKPYSSIVYHIGSSMKNPISFEDTKRFVVRYFNDNPILSLNGKPIIVDPKVKVLTTMQSFHNYLNLRYLPFIKVLGVVSSLSCCGCFKGLHDNLHRQLTIAMRLAELYKPYIFNKSIFDDENMNNLLKTSEKKGIINSDTIYFDPTCIDWEDYLLRIHFPAAVNAVAPRAG